MAQRPAALSFYGRGTGWLPGAAEAGEPAGPRRHLDAESQGAAAGVWHLLNDPAARYRDLGLDWHVRHTDRSRKARNARRQLEALGYDVIITLREEAA